MTYISSVKLLVKFDSLPIIDAINGDVFYTIGDQDINIDKDGLGYQMKQNQSLETSNINIAINSQFGIGFTLIPVNYAMGKDPNTGLPVPLNMFILDIKNTSTDHDFVQIFEQTQNSGKNKLVVNLLSSNIVVFTAKTPEYSVGERHLFFINYNGSTSTFNIYIDGLSVSLTTSGSIPVSLPTTNAIVRINKDVFNNTISTMNTGLIDEIVVTNSFATNDTIKNIVNKSLDFAFNSLNTNIQEISQVFLFNDPNAFRGTSLYSDGTSMLITRNDGLIIEGSQKFWEVRNVYNTTITDKIINI